MRIAVLPSSDLSYNSGSIIQAKRWFAHLRREGHDALLLGSRAPEDLSAELLAHVSIAPEILLHPVVVDRPVSDQEYLASISATLRFLMEQHAHKRLDLVHAQYASFTSYAAAVFATATGVPYLVSSFGRDLAAIEADPEGPLGRMGLRALATAGAIVTPTRAMSQVVQRLLGRDDLPLHEVPVPVDLEGTRISENVRPRELQPPLIASINSCFAEDKGIDCLLQALALLRGRRDFTCVIAGTDDHPTARHRRRLDALVRALDLAGHVSFVGYLDRPDVGALLARVAVLVDARTSNNFSSVCVEAQFAACPVVAADTPGSRAILEDRENSLLFRKDDPAALAAAIEAAVVPETGAALSRGARRWREEVGRRFREDVCFGYLQQICAAVAGKGSQRQEVA